MAKVSKKVRTVCPTCHYTFEDSYEDKFTTTKCPCCWLIFGIDSNGKAVNTHINYKKYQDVVAFGKDPKTGQEVGITPRGKRVEVDETRYDFKNDPHGWKATGKKVKGYERK